jgi:hypothetical protein
MPIIPAGVAAPLPVSMVTNVVSLPLETVPNNVARTAVGRAAAKMKRATGIAIDVRLIVSS